MAVKPITNPNPARVDRVEQISMRDTSTRPNTDRSSFSTTVTPGKDPSQNFKIDINLLNLRNYKRINYLAFIKWNITYSFIYFEIL